MAQSGVTIPGLRDRMKEAAPLDDLAEVFAALGSTPRLRMLYLLQQRPDLTVGELSELLDLSMSGVSTHLQRLRRAGLICCRRDGQTVCCALVGNSRHVRFLREMFRSLNAERS
jgi:ArsR family transcriptional regulator